MRIGIDMDGTVVDFTTASLKKVKDLYGIDIPIEDMTRPKTAQIVWEHMTAEQREKYNDHRELYGEICDEGFFESLKPFEGAVEAVNTIAEEGHEIVWITKILNWERSAKEKSVWLKNHFPNIKYKTIMVDSVLSKGLIDVDIIIDDDARVLANIHNCIKLMMTRPWNKNVSLYCIANKRVNNMQETLQVIRDASELHDFFLEKSEK